LHDNIIQVLLLVIPVYHYLARHKVSEMHNHGSCTTSWQDVITVFNDLIRNN